MRKSIDMMLIHYQICTSKSKLHSVNGIILSNLLLLLCALQSRKMDGPAIRMSWV